MVKLALLPRGQASPGRVQLPALGHPGRTQVTQGHSHGLQALGPSGLEWWSECLCRLCTRSLWSVRPFPPAQR